MELGTQRAAGVRSLGISHAQARGAEGVSVLGLSIGDGDLGHEHAVLAPSWRSGADPRPNLRAAALHHRLRCPQQMLDRRRTREHLHVADPPSRTATVAAVAAVAAPRGVTRACNPVPCLPCAPLRAELLAPTSPPTLHPSACRGHARRRLCCRAPGTGRQADAPRERRLASAGGSCRWRARCRRHGKGQARARRRQQMCACAGNDAGLESERAVSRTRHTPALTPALAADRSPTGSNMDGPALRADVVRACVCSVHGTQLCARTTALPWAGTLACRAPPHTEHTILHTSSTARFMQSARAYTLRPAGLAEAIPGHPLLLSHSSALVHYVLHEPCMAQ